jgi:hypothetical protein
MLYILRENWECAFYELIPYASYKTTSKYENLQESSTYIHTQSSVARSVTEDWERKSAKMSSIYEGSYLIVAATASAGDDAGFLGPRQARYLTKSIRGTMNPPNDGSSDIKVRIGMVHCTNTNAKPLARRAWTYQERLVPRRVLSYRFSEVTFEWKSSRWCECGRNETYGGYADRVAYFRSLTVPFKTQSLYNYCYTTLVREYMDLNLTEKTDRLPALSALAKQYQARTGDTYIVMEGVAQCRIDGGNTHYIC